MSTVLLLAGPAGGGKSSLSRRIAQNKGWALVSEDKVWDEIGHDSSKFRTPSEQKVVQALSIKHILDLSSKGKNVVFEFLVFDNPPRPIFSYQEKLHAKGMRVITRVLRPSIDEVLRRQLKRGRKTDVSRQEERRKQALHQLACLSSPLIKKEWVVDTTHGSLEENYKRHFRSIIQEATANPALQRRQAAKAPVPAIRRIRRRR